LVYDFVVVGAGISGASTAYHLRKGGAARVLLIDRGEAASGGTGKSAAIMRQSYSTPLLVRLARDSINMLAAMQDELGRGSGLVQSGYCFVLPESMVEGARRNVTMQKSLGIRNEWHEGSPISAHLPQINPERIVATVYEPDGGYADPVQATEAYVHGFVSLGGEFRARTPVRQLLRTGNRITGIELDEGKLSAGCVVNAAGPWAKPLAEGAGLAMEMRAVREQDTVWQVPLGRPVPEVSISMAVDATYFRPLGQHRFVIGRGFPKEYVDVDPYNYKSTSDPEFIRDIQTRVEQRFPAFAGMHLLESYAALYDVTPDWYPFVGPRSGIAGYADFCGGSGHGFKIGPAIGRELAEWLMTGNAKDDFRQFSHDRLAAGRPFVQSFGGNRG
jgi:sarcosine oxidase subunit beta